MQARSLTKVQSSLSLQSVMFKSMSEFWPDNDLPRKFALEQFVNLNLHVLGDFCRDGGFGYSVQEYKLNCP